MKLAHPMARHSTDGTLVLGLQTTPENVEQVEETVTGYGHVVVQYFSTVKEGDHPIENDLAVYGLGCPSTRGRSM